MSQYRQLINDKDAPDETRQAYYPPVSSPAAPPLPAHAHAEYTLYKRRWLLLATLALLNISSALSWITFAPVADDAATYFNTTEANVNWLSTVYMVTTIPFGFISTWIVDTYGLAPVIILGAGFNSVGLVIRYLSTLSLSIFHGHRFLVVMVGQGIASLAQPCFLFVPTKVAALWFPDSQRATANTLGSTSNPLGILLGFLLSSQLVASSEDIEFLLLVYMIPGLVSAALALVVMCYCKNVPPSPPSASAASTHETFFSGLKKIVCIKAFWVLFFVFGAGLAIFNSITTILEEVLCPRGYSDDFSGLCGAIMIAGGIVGAFVSGLYVDKTKKFALVAKVSMAFAALCGIALSVITRYPGLQIPIAAVVVGLGFFGFAQFPVSLELGVEATYPVAEGTSAGFLIMSGQIQGILLMLAAQWLERPLPPGVNTCQIQSSGSNLSDFHDNMHISDSESIYHDMTVTMLFYGGYAALAACVYMLCFHTKYKRLRAEHCNAADHILNFSSRNSSDQRNVIY